jgi:hypothetical protein
MDLEIGDGVEEIISLLKIGVQPRINEGQVYHLKTRKEPSQMKVKQLYEILGKYVDIGAGEWIVHLCQIDRFNTRKEYRDWSKTNTGRYSTFEVDQVIIFDVDEPDVDAAVSRYAGIKVAVLMPSLFGKDEGKAMYHLPTKDHVKGKKMTRTPKMVELVENKRSKKKSTKTIKVQRRK